MREKGMLLKVRSGRFLLIHCRRTSRLISHKFVICRFRAEFQWYRPGSGRLSERIQCNPAHLVFYAGSERTDEITLAASSANGQLSLCVPCRERGSPFYRDVFSWHEKLFEFP